METMSFDHMALQARCDLAMSRVLAPIQEHAAREYHRLALQAAYETGIHCPTEPASVFILQDPDLRSAHADGQHEGLSVWSAHGPLFVSTVKVRASEACDDDELFGENGWVDIECTLDAVGRCYPILQGTARRFEALLARGCGLLDAMEAAERFMRLCKAASRHGGLFDGDLFVKELVLLDQFAQPVQRLGQYGWLSPLPAPEWPACETRSRDLGSEAFRESGFDNHSTARACRRQADELQETLCISRRLERVVDKTAAAWAPL